jgi:uncharacterized membrane protein YecN with MAPEG domain
MINDSKHVLIAAVAAIGNVAEASADYVHHCGALLFMAARRLHQAHMERAQMRLAPARRVGMTQPSSGVDRIWPPAIF